MIIPVVSHRRLEVQRECLSQELGDGGYAHHVCETRAFS